MSALGGATASEATYRISVLATALVRMWRGWKILLPVIIGNALVQGLLTWPNLMPYLSVGFILLSAISWITLLASYALVTATMLQATTGSVDLHEVLRVVRDRWLAVLGWSSLLFAAVLLGLSLAILPGLLVLALAPFLLLAVVDGRRHPLAANFHVMRMHWGRWLVTVTAMGLICVVLWLVSALNGFFVTGAPGALMGWLLLGLVASWFTAAWALVYRAVDSPRA